MSAKKDLTKEAEEERDRTFDHYTAMGWEIMPGVFSVPQPRHIDPTAFDLRRQTQSIDDED